MRNWIIVYRLKDGTEGSVATAAANRIVAWDIFQYIVKENGWEVEAADCIVKDDEEEEKI